MRSGLLKGILLGLTVTVLFLTAAAAFAGTGIGGVFNLGRVNSVNAKSSLSGKTAKPMLKIRNKGHGRALSLITKPDVPPMKVSSRMTVPNLSANNAAHLEGVPADGFVRGPGVLQTQR